MASELPEPGANGPVAGIGSLVADQVFVESASGDVHYFASRGGGSVWNTLGHLALAGYQTAAFGILADDLPGQEALRELTQLGINTDGLVESADKHTRVFTQTVSEPFKHGTDVPQANFALECPVCEQTIRQGEVPLYSINLYRPERLKREPAVICTDRLTSDTAETAIAALARGALTALDLGGAAGKTSRERSEMRKRLGHFRVISMPIQVAAWLSQEDISSLSRQLLKSNTDLLALTKGSEGFELRIHPERGPPMWIAVPAADVPDVADATGAGDAFSAGLIACALGFGFKNSRDGRLRFNKRNIDNVIDVLRQAPLQTLRGIGARAAFPEYPMGLWAANLSPRRKRSLDSLQREFGSRRPCDFCQYQAENAD